MVPSLVTLLLVLRASDPMQGSSLPGQPSLQRSTSWCLGMGSPYPCCLHLRSPKCLKCKAITMRRARATD